MSQQLALQLDVPRGDDRSYGNGHSEARDSSLQLQGERSPSHLGRSNALYAFFSFSIGFLGVCLIVVFAGLFPTERVAIFSWNSIEESSRRLIHSALYEREVHLAEHLLPLEQVITTELDVTRSNFIWNLLPGLALERLSQVPLFELVSLERCSWFSFWCFRLTGALRQPRFQAELEGVVWLVDHMGRFLLPAEQYQQGYQTLDIAKLPELKGLSRYQSTPEVLQALSKKLIGVADVVNKVGRRFQEKERSIGSPHVLSVALNGAGDLILELSDFSIPLVLSGERLEKAELEKVANEIQSLRSLTADSLEGVRHIDLRFEGMAVYVREEPLPPPISEQ